MMPTTAAETIMMPTIGGGMAAGRSLGIAMAIATVTKQIVTAIRSETPRIVTGTTTTVATKTAIMTEIMITTGDRKA